MNPDHTLRKLFEELKRHDAVDAPLFHHSLPREEVLAARPRPIPYVRFAMAAAALCVVIAALWHFGAETPQPHDNSYEEWAALSTWQPTSDQLVAQHQLLNGDKISTPTDGIFHNETSTTQSPKNL